jgi:hypothetical protein
MLVLLEMQAHQELTLGEQEELGEQAHLEHY